MSRSLSLPLLLLLSPCFYPSPSLHQLTYNIIANLHVTGQLYSETSVSLTVPSHVVRFVCLALITSGLCTMR